MEGLYVLLTEDGKVAALFQNAEETGDLIRYNGEWTDPELDEIEELDGLRVVTIEPSFIEVFDKAQASGDTLDEAAVTEYKTETSQ